MNGTGATPGPEVNCYCNFRLRMTSASATLAPANASTFQTRAVPATTVVPFWMPSRTNLAATAIPFTNFSCRRQFIQSEWVTTKPQQLTSQPSLEPFRLLMTQLVWSCRHARQPTHCEEGTRSVRHVFYRGALRGRSPCTREGRRPDRPKYNNEGRMDTFARLIQGCESVAAE